MSEDAFLSDLGWNAWFETHRSGIPSNQRPARVVAEHRDAWLLATARGERLARLAGRLRHAAASRLDLPATGDWVAARLPGDDGDALIEAVLPRSSRLVRKAAGDTSQPQIVAANVDLVVIVAALDHDFNPRRLERYAAAVAEGGALPMALLNKADLCGDAAPFVAAARRALPDAPIVVASAVDGRGLAELRASLRPGLTAALVGSSGVGKSTTLNALVGHDVHATGEVREHDHRGRHVTTHRELVRLPWGALLVDTPGMRELAPWVEGDASAAFSDVDDLAAQCRFADCSHASEPGCGPRCRRGRTARPRSARGMAQAREGDPLARQPQRRSRSLGAAPSVEDHPQGRAGARPPAVLVIAGAVARRVREGGARGVDDASRRPMPC